MIPEYWGYVAAIINLLGTISYLVAIANGKARPNRVTWFVLGLSPTIAFFSMLSQDVSLAQGAMTLSAGLGPLAILITTFFVKHPAWKIKRFDVMCGILAIVGLILWFITGKGNIAIMFSILAGGLAFLPTLIKSYKYPETESPWVFLVGLIAAIISLLTLTTWDFEQAAFMVYLVVVSASAFSLIYFKIGMINRQRHDRDTTEQTRVNASEIGR